MAAFWIAAVGKFHGTTSGAPVHSDTTGRIAPSWTAIACVLGPSVIGFKKATLPMVAWSPPGYAFPGPGQFSLGVTEDEDPVLLATAVVSAV